MKLLKRQPDQYRSSVLACFIIFLVLMAGIAAAQTPRYQNYSAQFPLLGGDAAEPSIGVNWSSGNIMYQAGLETLRVRFDDSTSPARTAWVSTESLLTSLFSLDPISFTDRRTNRTFVSELDAGCSLTAYTDDDGSKWQLSVGCGIPAGIDHQSIGGGPYVPELLLIPPLYPDSVFYCSQDLVTAFCARSDNGGFTFGIGIPMYLLTQCGGRHGRIKVAPDGTLYVPNSGCNGKQGVAVSENNGLSWTVRIVPASTSGASDPSIGTGAGNKVYFGYQNGDGHPHIATSTDRGKTWQSDKDVGTAFGITNIVFPAVVAGDNNRAAFAFLGTKTAGNYEDPTNFSGIWHLYIASTFDGGLSWTTVDVTPSDPVQYGSIQLDGDLQPSGRHITPHMSTPLLDRGDRNLLDFIDATVDKQGRVLIAYADGCIGSCVTVPSTSLSRSALATIARQSGGRRLFAAYDPVEPAKPAAPLLTATRDSSGIHLSWEKPDNGGSPITKYKIYRGIVTRGETLYKTVGLSTTFNDVQVEQLRNYFYRVTAVNALGEGPLSNEISQ